MLKMYKVFLKYISSICFFALLFFIIPDNSQAQDLLQTSDRPLKVGVYVDPPFVINRGNEKYDGIATELWNEISRARGFAYKHQIFPDKEGLLKAVSEGKIDVALGDIGVEARYESKLDYTHSYLQSNLAIAVKSYNEASLLLAFTELFSMASLQAFIIIILILFSTSLAIWFLERKNNEAIFGDKNKDFISGAIWSAILVFALDGDLFKMKTRLSRFLGLMLLIVGTTIIASYVAVLSSALTEQKLSPLVKDASQLEMVRVGVEKGSLSEEFMDLKATAVMRYDNVNDALIGLGMNEVQAVVGEKYEITFAIEKENKSNIIVLRDAILQDNIAFALPQGSPIKEAVNISLLEIIEKPTWLATVEKYLKN